MSSANRENVNAFIKQLKARNLSGNTIKHYERVLELYIDFLQEKKFEDATADDVVDFIEYMKDGRNSAKTLSDRSLALYKVKFKAFYQWLFKLSRGKYPSCVDWVNTTIPKSKIKPSYTKQDILSDEDVKKLIQSASNPRDQALIMALYESAARASEIIDMRVGSVVFDDFGAVLVVTGKTGPRNLRVVESVPYLQTWINSHPQGGDLDTPLWPSLRNFDQRLNYQGLYKMLKVVSKRAGFRKMMNPHLFRHSRLTFLAGKLTEQQLKVYSGWMAGSTQAATYVHMSGKDLDADILRIHGLDVPEEMEHDSVLKPVECPSCKYPNTATAKVCVRCGSYLSLGDAVKTELSHEDRINRLENLLNERESKIQDIDRRLRRYEQKRELLDSSIEELEKAMKVVINSRFEEGGDEFDQKMIELEFLLKYLRKRETSEDLIKNVQEIAEEYLAEAEEYARAWKKEKAELLES